MRVCELTAGPTFCCWPFTRAITEQRIRLKRKGVFVAQNSIRWREGIVLSNVQVQGAVLHRFG